MKIAIIGSRTITVNNLESYLPNNITTIITGVAVGVDTSARNYARANGIRLVE